MKKLAILFAGFLLLTGAAQQPGDGAFDAQVNTIKQECKDLIKGTRYEGTKVTYYNAGKSRQTKKVEVFLLLSNEYQFAVSAKKCTVPLTVRIYDAPEDAKDRHLVMEYKGIKGKNFTFSSSELNTAWRKQVKGADRLKNLHIEYALGSGKNNKEAIVMVMGHKP